MRKEVVDELLYKWCSRVKRSQFAHRFTAKGLSGLHLILGISAVVMATVTGTAIFASLETGLPGYGRILTGLLSLAAALLSALQTFLRLDERSKMHQRADASYSAIRQRIEQYQAIRHEKGYEAEDLEGFLALVGREMSTLSKDAPLVPERYWQKARMLLAKQVNASSQN